MYLATLSRTSAILTHVTPLHSSGTLQNLHGAPPHHPFQNPQYPHPIPQRHIARPCPSHLPKTRTHPQPQPRRIAPPCPPIILTEAAQNKHHHLASPPPTPRPTQLRHVPTYISETNISISQRGTARYASPHVENKRDGMPRRIFHPFAFAHAPLFTSTALSSHLFWVYMKTLAS
jgi:hypothetical protein